MKTNIQLALTLKKRLLFLLCTFLVGFFIVSIVTGILMWKFPSSTPAVRISTIIQDIVLFIMPAVVTALLVTRTPASLLCIDRNTSISVYILAALVLTSSIPAMNLIIYLNANIPLPESVATTLKTMEDSAQVMVEMLQGPHDVPNLIMSILIIGILAGLSEELLFRGGLQRLLVTGGVNKHVAIWTSAILFSLLHMQFYGFVPRTLLGAFFGYALLWSGTLWLPIILHALNNTMYLIMEWINYGSEEPSAINSIGNGSDFIAVAVSVALVIIFMKLLYKYTNHGLR